jgi:serine/threonine protein kinase
MAGAMLGDRYCVIRQLGEGAMGQVFLAEHLDLGRREAVKVLRPDIATDPAFVQRFRREARATNRVQHRNIVGLYDFGRLPDGRLFLAMELADGQPLDGVLREQGRLAVPRALSVIEQLATAVEHAHSHGVIHRDLKPENMILVEDRTGAEVLKILDFGIAKIIAPDYEESVQLTKQGEIFGTPAYMAPEQFRGATIDHRVDIYAIGCIAYELVVGEPPFVGRLVELMRQHVDERPPRASRRLPEAGIPELLDTIIATCMEKEPGRRFQSAANVLALLRQIPELHGDRPVLRSGRKSRLLLDARASRDSFSEPTDVQEDRTDPHRGPWAAADDVSELGRTMLPTELGGAEADDLETSSREVLMELGERLVDRGERDLIAAMGALRVAQDDLARVDQQVASLEARSDTIEQRSREREASLRFAIGELSFDRQSAEEHMLADIDLQLNELQSRLAALRQQTRGELDQILESAIELAAERDTADERVGGAFIHLRTLIEPRFAELAGDLVLAPLIDQYESMRSMLDEPSG